MENNELSNEELSELKNLAKALKQMRESNNQNDQNAVVKIENAVAKAENEQAIKPINNSNATVEIATGEEESTPTTSVDSESQNTYKNQEYWQVDDTDNSQNQSQPVENFYQREARQNAIQNEAKIATQIATRSTTQNENQQQNSQSQIANQQNYSPNRNSNQQNNSQNHSSSQNDPYDTDKTGVGIFCGIFIPIIFSLLIGFCFYPSQSYARSSFFKAYWLTFGICVTIGVFIGGLLRLIAIA